MGLNFCCRIQMVESVGPGGGQVWAYFQQILFKQQKQYSACVMLGAVTLNKQVTNVKVMKNPP